MRRLAEVAKWYLFKEPSKDFSRWFYLIVGGLILLQAAYLWIDGFAEPTEGYSIGISLTAGLGFVAMGLAESLPARWRAGLAALRIAQLVLVIACVAILVLLFLNWGQT